MYSRKRNAWASTRFFEHIAKNLRNQGRGVFLSLIAQHLERSYKVDAMNGFKIINKHSNTAIL